MPIRFVVAWSVPEFCYGRGPEGTEFDARKAFLAVRRRVGTI